MKSKLIRCDDFRSIFRNLRKQLHPHGLDIKVKTWRDHDSIQFEVVEHNSRTILLSNGDKIQVEQ